jgi:dual-specificity kinase
MSTPTTVATLPPPHHFGRHQAYQPSATARVGLAGALANGSSTRASASHTHHTYSNSASSASDHRRPSDLNPRTAAAAALQDDPQMNPRSRRQRGPDWNNFYRNGVPKEVIVIDDDDTPDSATTLQHDTLLERHKDKKRKTGAASAYDPVYNPQPSYSTTQTPYYENSSANHTTSTDRTAPAYKASGSSSIGPPLLTNGTYYSVMDEAAVGHKRKRAARAADENKGAKRREIQHDQSPYSAYVPPKQPTIKAKDVYVECIKEVPSACRAGPSNALQTSLPKEKHDDSDGHYLVEPEASLTDRCEYFEHPRPR